MFIFNEILMLCFVAVTVKSEAFSYCDPNICSAEGLKHVACDEVIEWADRCPPDAEFVEFGSELQQILLDSHNKLRNQVAMGELSGYPSAARMATMTWDDELAELAKYNTMQCQMEHDIERDMCHSTRLFYESGQNLNEATNIDDAEMADWAPRDWFSEYMYMSVENIAKFEHSEENGKWVGHFTQTVKDNSYKVGCSISKYSDGSTRKSLMACNYAVGNIDGIPIYEEGPTASDCTNGTNSQYPGLCNDDELYEGPFFRRDFDK